MVGNGHSRTRKGAFTQSARCTILPPTIVATTLPVNCHPSNGVLCDNDRDFAASKVQRFLGSNIVTSPKQPFASDPRPRRSKRVPDQR